MHQCHNGEPAKRSTKHEFPADSRLSHPKPPTSQSKDHLACINNNPSGPQITFPNVGVSLAGPKDKRPDITRLARTVIYVVRDGIIFLAIALTTILSLGIPYWYYRCYRLRRHSQNPPDAEGGLELLYEEKWQQTVKYFRSQWRAYYALAVGTLPIIFPLLSTYPVPKCSWAFLFATISLLSGVMSLVIGTLYRNRSNWLCQPARKEFWHINSCTSWRHVSTQQFWLLVSLPTIWLLSSISALTISVMLAVWEQVSSVAGTPGDLCLPWRLHIFRGITSTLIVMALMHLALVAFISTSL